jgi:Flp pilus assembly protein TadG
MPSFRTRGTDNSGAVAVIVAISCVMLFSMGALVVDLGNTFTTRRDLQAQADFAALAAGDFLPGTKSAGDLAVQAAANYLTRNNRYHNGAVITPTQLVNNSDSDGEVYFTDGGNKIRVVAPTETVQYGLARVIGMNQKNVAAHAVVGVFSPGNAVMPAYAVSGCDWGPQTLTDPANGNVTPTGPTLWEGSDGTADSNAAASFTLNPTQVQKDANTGQLTLSSNSNNGLQAVTKIGFFLDGNGSTGPQPVIIALTAANHVDGHTITVNLPIANVTDTENLYWVRVWIPNASQNDGGAWSAAAANNGSTQAQAFQVGNPVLQCVGASNDGNFGTLKIARQDTPDGTVGGWLPTNIAVGLQPPLSLHKFMGSVDPTTGLCNPAPPNSNTSYSSGNTIYTRTTGNTPISDLLPQTNCVDTDTGLPANAATAGLITGTPSGVGSVGRLENKPTTCGPGGSVISRSATLNHTTYTFNNDSLSCYLSAGATISDVSGPNYTFNGGAPVIPASIYDSPRAIAVPVLKVTPQSGGSQHYAIVDFRIAFISDSTGDNGIQISGNDVTKVNVVFINPAAVMPDNSGHVVDFLGAGPKIVRLID